MGIEPYIGLSSGYFRRAIDRMPKQAATAPWRADQDYLLERRTIGGETFDDGVMRFEGARAATAA